ncbi:helix-turn-helix transcriptional regulator [Sphingobacterium corticis]|uniref:Helix-turn-helix transcriptional regulator n=1 Tax=Sphingobacterium corticis TaxID=1812823 RepID=A0ABW5NF82_9SPHI
MDKQSIKTTFAANLKAYRAIKGYSQQQLAEMFGIKRSSLGAYEECRALPRVDDFSRIASIMAVSMESLINSEIKWIPTN